MIFLKKVILIFFGILLFNQNIFSMEKDGIELSLDKLKSYYKAIKHNEEINIEMVIEMITKGLCIGQDSSLEDCLIVEKSQDLFELLIKKGFALEMIAEYLLNVSLNQKDIKFFHNNLNLIFKLFKKGIGIELAIIFIKKRNINKLYKLYLLESLVESGNCFDLALNQSKKYIKNKHYSIRDKVLDLCYLLIKYNYELNEVFKVILKAPLTDNFEHCNKVLFLLIKIINIGFYDKRIIKIVSKCPHGYDKILNKFTELVKKDQFLDEALKLASESINLCKNIKDECALLELFTILVEKNRGIVQSIDAANLLFRKTSIFDHNIKMIYNGIAKLYRILLIQNLSDIVLNPIMKFISSKSIVYQLDDEEVLKLFIELIRRDFCVETIVERVKAFIGCNYFVLSYGKIITFVFFKKLLKEILKKGYLEDVIIDLALKSSNYSYNIHEIRLEYFKILFKIGKGKDEALVVILKLLKSDYYKDREYALKLLKELVKSNLPLSVEIIDITTQCIECKEIGFRENTSNVYSELFKKNRGFGDSIDAAEKIIDSSESSDLFLARARYILRKVAKYMDKNDFIKIIDEYCFCFLLEFNGDTSKLLDKKKNSEKLFDSYIELPLTIQDDREYFYHEYEGFSNLDTIFFDKDFLMARLGLRLDREFELFVEHLSMRTKRELINFFYWLYADIYYYYDAEDNIKDIFESFKHAYKIEIKPITHKDLMYAMCYDDLNKVED